MPKPCLKTIFPVLCLLFFLSLKAQDPIGGIVNTYHKVYQVIPSKACVRVTDITGLNVNSKVMIVQMKGATIQTGTGNTFGDTISTNGAGLYEIATICYIIGDSVFMFHDLLNTYDPAAKLQLVQFSEHYSATVTSQIRPALWDSTTGLGGVIAISVDETLELQANIYGDTSGFSGGAFFDHSGNCGFGWAVANLYAYDATNFNSSENGAYKGEGVSNVPSLLDGGRGAPANGGGGGNNHNNSGGGGANLTAGGLGGGNHSNGPFLCNTTLRGLGGKPLLNWGGKKIFLGGGGGAGHTNFDGITTGGGDGGGIIFIHAAIVIGNGFSISANGEAGAISISDGAGGGGAGGTIIMDVAGYTGSLVLQANGGKGGDSNDNGTPDRCFGGGGGGSGGTIYFTGPLPGISYSVTAGAGGVESGSTGTCQAAQPGVAGTGGIITSGYTYRRSTNEAAYCELLLPVGLTVFTAKKAVKKVALHWEVANPEQASLFIIERASSSGNWSEWKSVDPGNTVHEYAAIDPSPLPGKSYYRLKILEKDGSVSYSVIRTVEFHIEGYRIYPNPASGKIIIASENTIPVTARLYDLAGRLLFTKYISQPGNYFELDLPSLKAGVYMIKLNDAVKKLVIK